jgi:glycosyltransferase involved in cell wall biosynthesis
MRILIITQYFWPENFKINDLAIGLKNKGHRVTVFTGLPNYPEGKFYNGYSFFKGPFKENNNGIEIIRIPLTPRKSGTGIYLMLNYLSFAIIASLYARFRLKNRFDKIFVFEISPITVGLPAVVLKKKYNIPIYFWVLDLWPESVFAASNINKSRFLVYFLEKIVRFIYNNSHLILISSQSFKNSIVNKDVSPDKIKYFPNWAEDVFLSYNENLSVEMPKFPEGFNILYAGNIGEAQDFENIFEGISECSKYIFPKKVNWIFIGDGRKRSWLENEIKNRNLGNNVFYWGSFKMEEVPYFFIKADVLFVSLKKDEIFKLTVPAKVQTYMAAKKPILAMMSGEGKDIIEEANCGFVAESGEPKRISSLVHKLISMKGKELKLLGENGYQFYLANFNKSKLISKLEEWLKS